MKKYIFITGGVCSSLGKGLAAASIGALLEGHKVKVCMVKIDPYLNVDAGTMSPYQHGEVYVTDDGAETDLDLGNYYRFTNSPVGRLNTITTGQIYQEVIRKEREGKYLGRTVQMIPHITDEIKRRIFRASEENSAEVTVVEVGGTVGDFESVPFLEAARQFRHDIGKENVLFIHLTLVPQVTGEELKTKPTQHSVKELREIGIQPDVLLCRAPVELDDELKKKIALFTNVERRAIISAYDVNTTVYEIPLVYLKEGLREIIIDKLSLSEGKPNMSNWQRMVDSFLTAKKKVRIAMVGKYLNLTDSYKSVNEALCHGGMANKCRVEIVKVDAEELESMDDLDEAFRGVNGILIPGGFGKRGIEGMIRTAEYARTRKVPCLGICLGLQVMVIEYARNRADIKGAHSTEFCPEAAAPVVSLLEEQEEVKDFGGTMRLGREETLLKEGTLIQKSYGKSLIHERHRHRYEVSVKYREILEEAGLIIAGVTRGNRLVESVQWPEHPWSVGVQFHPEFTSRPISPHPLFSAFIEASIAGASSGKEE